MNDLEQSILKTLAFFDLFCYPLTSWEIFKWLYQPTKQSTYNEVLTGLLDLKNSGRLEELNGFYFLPGQKNHITKRSLNYSLAQIKYRRAKRFVRVLKNFPWIKAILVCNTLAYNNAGESSDIDLLIVATPGRLWLTRLLVLGLLKLLGCRPKINNKKDAIDVAFFVADNHFDFSSLTLENNGVIDDPDFAYWLEKFVPLYGEQNLIEKIALANPWLKDILPNAYGVRPPEARFEQKDQALRQVKNWEITNYLEAAAKALQLKIMPLELKQAINQSSNVSVTDNWLKFHLHDPREKYRTLWQERLKDLNLL